MPKSPAIEKFLNDFAKDAFGYERTGQQCVTCGETHLVFRDDESKKEFAASHMCQACQDSVFGV